MSIYSASSQTAKDFHVLYINEQKKMLRNALWLGVWADVPIISSLTNIHNFCLPFVIRGMFIKTKAIKTTLIFFRFTSSDPERFLDYSCENKEKLCFRQKEKITSQCADNAENHLECLQVIQTSRTRKTTNIKKLENPESALFWLLGIFRAQNHPFSTHFEIFSTCSSRKYMKTMA